MNYTCPLCGKEMDRDLVLFLDHTNQHVIDQIKLSHPEWVAENGTCQPCAAYYQREISGENTNIGPVGTRNRMMMGMVFIGLSLAAAFYLRTSEIPRFFRLGLFIPLFLGIFGLTQAQTKTCAVLAAMKSQNMDFGPIKIQDATLAQVLKRKGNLILLGSAVAAALLTALFLFTPTVFP